MSVTKIHSYNEALQYLNSFINYELRLPGEARAYGLERVQSLLLALGSPHKKTPFVHIAGSKGKGSTAAMLEAILRSSGYKVGLYTSPHLIDLKERIRIDGSLITEDLFTEIIRELQPYLDEIEQKRKKGADLRAPTYYEIFTHLAMRAFELAQCDIAILEVGLGGRLDATNVIENPLAVGITEISFEHTNILGNTLKEIAYEKSGIIKEGRPVFTSAKADEAIHEIKRVANLMSAPFSIPALTSFETNLLGAHQKENASLAVALANSVKQNGFDKITDATIAKGLANVDWQGRLQLIETKTQGSYLLDGAHTLDSIKLLIKESRKLSSAKDFALIFAVADDKDYSAMLKVLCDLADTIILTTSKHARAVPPKDLKDLALKYFKSVTVEPDVNAALKMAPDKLRIITGSLYLVGAALEIISRC